MSTTIKVKRGLESARTQNVFDIGELVLTTDSNKVYVGDGSTAGGKPITASFAENARSASFVNLSGSKIISSSLQFTNTDTVTFGQITASSMNLQKLYVQTITSSVEYILGSSMFGSSLNDTHEITGSMYITGSFSVAGVTTVDSIKTSNPIGGTAYAVKFGGYTESISTASGTIRIEINGVAYDILVATASHASPSFISATGGTVTTDGNYKIHTFTSSGVFTVTSVSSTPTVDFLVVGGGGGGGGGYASGNNPGGAGGGAGGVIYQLSSSISVGSYDVIVGDGGAGGLAGTSNYGTNGTSGSNSSFNSLIAIGGGYGATFHDPYNSNPGGNGGSGGGGEYSSGGTGTSGQGYAGGSSAGGSQGGAGGGGGGAASVGTNSNINVGGAGGSALSNNITGTTVYYGGGGGGGGGGVGAGYGVGGTNAGSGSVSTNGQDAPANRGGGGGGGGAGYRGGNGGSGIVIIRYLYQ